MFLPEDYFVLRERIEKELAVHENFDIIEKKIALGKEEMTFFSVDGFVKDGELQKVIQSLLTKQAPVDAGEAERALSAVETEVITKEEDLLRGVLSGQTALLCSTFRGAAILMDLRRYPGREPSEPESDKVMQGARDGFVETLVTNTALIRRRVRDTRLRMIYVNLGGCSKTDVVVCYMAGVADAGYVEKIIKKLRSSHPRTLTLGFQSLAETLIRQKWYNPFPKIRTTERPDTASAQVLEGNVLILCDTSPQVMVLPTSIFDYLQQTDDYYYPPLTGSYLRLVRTAILLLSLIATPLWYLYLGHADLLPDGFRFLIPDHPGALPILLQLYLAEIAVDGLKIASMNTPDMLSNSLSIVGALLLGNISVNVGWFCEDVILYTAFIAIANFAQQNHELGYAYKFMRVLILSAVALADIYGFLFGIGVTFVFLLHNASVVNEKRYLYPLIPWNGKAMRNLLFRTRKKDFLS